ncbi:MAG: DUF1573 domain-containing protein [Spirochaetes bacterium]|nr:DUF1573 domain-containing protein [Spirochaetota bacterium]
MRINRFPLFIITGALLVVAAFGFYNYFRLDITSPPGIEITPHSYNFGVIPRRPVEKDFIVKNTGGKLLLITGINTSCGCTTAVIKKKKLTPGEQTKLLVTFDPNVMNKGMTGDIYRIVYIRSNDPERLEVKIEIRATLKKSDGN